MAAKSRQHRTVVFESDNLTTRETQIINVLVTLSINVAMAPFIGAGHELSEEQRRHICEDVALVMQAQFPDVHFYVDTLDVPERPFPGPEFPT
jgi:hypothetical protein